jgi:hypothetical protein
MKKFFTLSLVTVGLVFLFTGCVKDRYGVDESYWLSKERGVVVYADQYCQYYVVETANGYSVVRARNGYKPFEDAVLYGDFSNFGTREFYNRTYDLIFTGEVIESWLTYYDAQQAVDYYCY